ncbi:hypothetical protein [Burkholderia cepacia]|uniref:hypothetical protein n=1 Tax=Burkholderia cepacia TaxID=292 RepID=UPI000A5A6FB6|nr:hypothetical protein [Burkholderia cepacia]
MNEKLNHEVNVFYLFDMPTSIDGSCAISRNIAMILMVSALSFGIYAPSNPANATETEIKNNPIIDIKGRIINIDTSSRIVALQGFHGNTVEILIRPEVAGFDQLNIDDIVVIVYRSAVLMAIEKAKGVDSPILERIGAQTSIMSNSPRKAANRISMKANVEGVDLARRRLTLHGVLGTQSMIAPSDIDLSTFRRDDIVHATFQPATAIKIISVNVAKR